MPFFPNTSGFAVTGNNLTDVAGDFNLNMITQYSPGEMQATMEMFQAGRRKKNRDHNIIKLKNIDLEKELFRGTCHRIHSGKYKGRAVIVKVFSGPRSDKRCAASAAFARRLFPRHEKNAFTDSDGFAHKSTPECLPISKDGAQSKAGLSYIHSQNISLRDLLGALGGLDDFELLAGANEEPILVMNTDIPESTHHCSDALAGNEDWDLFNSISEKTFQEANRILYDDVPERIAFDLESHCYDDYGSDPYNILCNSNLADGLDKEEKAAKGRIQTTDAGLLSGSQTPVVPRRELRWIDLGTQNQSLELVCRQYEQKLDSAFASQDSALFLPGNMPLRRLRRERARKLTTKQHTCSLQYLREEITLSTDLSRSAIVSHAAPDLHEKCMLCGQLFEDETGDVLISSEPAIDIMTTQHFIVGHQFSPPALADSATQPPLPSLLITCPYLPWGIVVTSSSSLPDAFVSIGDVLEALRLSLRIPITHDEYRNLSEGARKEVDAAYFARCGNIRDSEEKMKELSRGVKRVDFLQGKNRFMGLSATIRGPDIWELNVS